MNFYQAPKQIAKAMKHSGNTDKHHGAHYTDPDTAASMLKCRGLPTGTEAEVIWGCIFGFATWRLLIYV